MPQITFSQSLDSWVQLNDFPVAGRSNAVSFVINDQGYIGTGQDSAGNLLKDFWKYDPGSNSWSQIADFSGQERSGAVGFAINAFGYVGTGFDGSTFKSDFWQYNPSLNTWTQIQDMGAFRATTASGRRDASVSVLNNFAYVFCGYDGTPGYNKQTWRFDPLADTSWLQRKNLGNVNDLVNNGRRWAVSFTAANAIYFGTGFNYTQNIRSDIWKYDPNFDAWSQVADFGGSFRSNAIGFSLYDKGYITCGVSARYYRDMWRYDPSGNSWTAVASFPGEKIANGVAFVIKNRAYAGLGNDSLLNMHNEFWCYYPDSTTGVAEVILPLSFQLYPNPAKDYILLTFPEQMKDFIFSINDNEGKMLYQKKSLDNYFRFERKDLPPGIYHITITSREGKSLTKKVIFY